MLDSAVENGADYAKIQSIRSSHLTQRERFEKGVVDAKGKRTSICRPYGPELTRLASLDLTVEQEQAFAEACRQAGIRAMTTPFSRAVISEIVDLGFDAVKVASYDCGSLPFLKELVQHWDHIFVSTGATKDDEIEQAAHILRDCPDWSFLHCVTIYPTPANQMHLARLSYLSLYSKNVGLSSHPLNSELGIQADMVALSLGAQCIERHFTILEPNQSKDGPVSMTPMELKALREFANLEIAERREIVRRKIPNWSVFLGSANRTLSETEMLNRDYYRGRFASPASGGWIYNWEEKSIELH